MKWNSYESSWTLSIQPRYISRSCDLPTKYPCCHPSNNLWISPMMHLTDGGCELDAETEGVQFQLQITDTRTAVASLMAFSSMSRSYSYVQVICFNFNGISMTSDVGLNRIWWRVRGIQQTWRGCTASQISERPTFLTHLLLQLSCWQKWYN